MVFECSFELERASVVQEREVQAGLEFDSGLFLRVAFVRKRLMSWMNGAVSLNMCKAYSWMLRTCVWLRGAETRW